jgi:hypothetical protein
MEESKRVKKLRREIIAVLPAFPNNRETKDLLDGMFGLVTKLRLGYSVLEALASRSNRRKLELSRWHSQTGVWEPGQVNAHELSYCRQH